MRTFFRLLLLALVLMSVALVSALTAMRLAIHGREVAVPRLIGITPAEAERSANANGLLFETENRFYSAVIPEGRIMSQVPPPGARVRRGWRVRVAESLGPQRVMIPNFIGQSSRAAEINVHRRGLELGTIAVAHIADLPADQVVAQTPLPNASGVASPKVNLLVTAASEPFAMVMPELVGRSLPEAARLIEQAGLRLAKVKTLSAPEAAASAETRPSPGVSSVSLVTRQAPTAGQKVIAGADVYLEAAAKPSPQ